jgi:hypothetical protein
MRRALQRASARALAAPPAAASPCGAARCFARSASPAPAPAQGSALLDALWVLPNRNWLETQVDFASVQATALGSWAQRVAAYARHMKAVK